jgi:hypothetical protein
MRRVLGSDVRESAPSGVSGTGIAAGITLSGVREVIDVLGA